MHKVYLDAYHISKYEVTNAEYYEFWKLHAATPQKVLQHTPENFTHLPQIGEWPARAKTVPELPGRWHFMARRKRLCGMERHAIANRSGVGESRARLHR